MSSSRVSRRCFLRAAGLGAGGLLVTQLGAFRATPALLAQGRVAASSVVCGQVRAEPFVPDAEVSITAVQKTVPILSGAETSVYTYEGKLLSGSGVTVDAVPGSYLGPILRAKTGTKLRIIFQNQLPEDSVIHPHGLRVPEQCDGSPMQAIGPGQTKLYEFTVIDQAGPYWFHPHPMGRTAEQVVLGMAGLFYVWDEDEDNAIPGAQFGANDVPVVIQDRSFDSNNQIRYQPNMMWGYLGDRILVNGQPDAILSLEPRAYRLRILNGSNARTYKLAWNNGMPLQVIGTDGGLLPEVVTKEYVMLMPGERLDVWADLSKLAGEQVVLQSAPFTPGGMGMMGGRTMGGGMMGGGMMGRGMGRMGGETMGSGMGMMGGANLPNGAAFNVLTVKVGRDATVTPQLGPLPPLAVRYDSSNTPNFATPIPFELSMQHMMTWTINGRVYEDMVVAEDEKVFMDEVTAWEWVNNSPIPHPMHIHNVQFQVVQRTTTAVASGYAEINQGLVDSGWKDTVSVWPGERVKIAMKFGPHTGMYMYHCHILEHEDMTMMRNLMVMDAIGTEM